jgi:hypothetical protein
METVFRNQSVSKNQYLRGNVFAHSFPRNGPHVTICGPEMVTCAVPTYPSRIQWQDSIFVVVHVATCEVSYSTQNPIYEQIVVVMRHCINYGHFCVKQDQRVITGSGRKHDLGVSSRVRVLALRPEGLRLGTKICSQDSRCPDRDPNIESPEYKSRTLPQHNILGAVLLFQYILKKHIADRGGRAV